MTTTQNIQRAITHHLANHYTPDQIQLVEWLSTLTTTNKYLLSLKAQLNDWLNTQEQLFPVPFSDKQLAALRRTYQVIYKPREEKQKAKNRVTLIGGPLNQKQIELPPDTQGFTITTAKTQASYIADTIAGVRVFLHQPSIVAQSTYDQDEHDQNEAINQQLLEQDDQP